MSVDLPERDIFDRVPVIRELRRLDRILFSPSTARPVRHRRQPGFDLRVTGFIYCAMMMFMGLAAINDQANLLFAVFGLMIGVLLISGVICRAVLTRLRVTRQLPESAVVGESTCISYQFHNEKRFWPSMSVSLWELSAADVLMTQPTAYMLHTAAGMTATVPVQVMPKRRGVYQLGEYQLGTGFPFGFIRRAVVRSEPDTLVIFPALGHVSPRLMEMCRSSEKSGAPMRPQRGGQDEFYGIKEYRRGDNPRNIYWRRSARVPGQILSKEMTNIAPPRLLILVDTRLPDGSLASRTTVERTIAMAASVASKALEDAMAVGLCAWAGEKGWATLSIQRGKRHRLDLLAALAALPENRTTDAWALFEAARPMMTGSATSMIFTASQAELDLGQQARGSIVVVGSNSRWASTMFTFHPGVDFAASIPADQSDPQKPKRRGRRAIEDTPSAPAASVSAALM